jgi:acyl transferase domain-containing protein/acyl carrier protein
MMTHRYRDTPLAIIGMACRLPGADDLDEYWALLRAARCALIELPPERFDQSLYYHPDRSAPGKSYARLGGVVPDRPFRRDLCPVPDELIASADIAHLNMLEVAATACHHARLDPLALPARNTGVFIGHARGSMLAGDMAYATHIEELGQYLDEAAPAAPAALRESVKRGLVSRVRASTPRRGAGGKPDSMPSAIAALIVEAFGLAGPCMAVDAACASSFYALALAARALQSGRIEMAIVGGASYSGWQSMILFSHAQALSAQGSSPFDSRADGFVSADGYAAILVKTLPRALADGDVIHGVLRGIGVSTDGHGKSLWAPRKEGQIEAIRRAYGRGLEPARMQYMEAHGTSTQLGDSTEVEALSEVLGQSPGLRIPIASVKANIGHTRETAGLAGLIKTLLAMQHGCIPPAASFERPNPQIDWDRIPFFVPTQEIEWPRDGGAPRRAAVDAFGIGGLNVHVVVDQDDGAPRAISSAGGMAGVQITAGANDSAGDVNHAAGGAEADAAAIAAGDAVAIAAGDAAGDAVAIVGVGAIFAGARTAAAFRELLRAGIDARCTVPAGRWSAALFCEPGARGPWRSPIALGGFITDFEYDWRAHKIPPRQIETADPLQFMLLDAVDQALADAGYRDRSFDRRRTGVVVGTMFIGDFATQLNLVLHLPELERTLIEELCTQGMTEAQARDVAAAMRDAIMRDRPMLRDETGSYTSSTLASRVAKSLDLMGGACAVDAAEASSMAALSTAVEWLASGACDMVLCAGAQRGMDISVYETSSLRGHLATGEPRPAFDREACGLVPGEGVGSFVLKRLGDARRDGDRVRAIIRGIGVASDAGAPAVALRRAVESALDQASVPAQRVAAVAAMGTAIPAFDAMELDALATSYGRAERERALYVSSTAGQIGYCFGAAGSAALLHMIFAAEDRVLPAGCGPKDRIQSSVDGAGRIEIITGATPLQDKQPWLGGVNAFSLRGLCYHVLIEPGAPANAEITASTAAREHVAWCTLRMGASDLAELRQRVARKADDGASLFAAAQASRFSRQDTARLAIVAHGPDDLAEKVQLAARQMQTPEARQALADKGVFVHERGVREPGMDAPRVAFLFPGQGSQYAGMLRELVELSPAAAARRDEIDACMARLGHPSFAQLAWTQTEGLGTDVWHTQLSVLLADLIALAALTGLGVRPDVISAHSYGEYPALVAAGVWTLETAVQVTRARCQAIDASERAQGELWSTTAPLDEVERQMAGMPSIWVANHNAPDQTVLGGEAGAVQALASRLEAAGFQAARLPVPRPFHTPLMAEVQEPLRDVLAGARMSPPRTPVLSSVSGRYVADPIDIRANLVAQLTEPVWYVKQIQRLVKDGVRVLVEVGPRQVLTQLTRRILGDPEVLVMAVDNPRRPGLEQLLRVQAALETAGALAGEAEASSSHDALAATRAAAPATATIPIVHFDAMQRRKSKLQQPAPAPVSVAPPSAPVNTEDVDELERFLIQFVCEHTGYPAELVELDVDLEADLGIDSIKKAQLFGELREHFDIQLQPGSKMSLSDFSTLRHVADFLRQRKAEGMVAMSEVTATEAAPDQPGSPASLSASVPRLPEPAAEPAAGPAAGSTAALVAGSAAGPCVVRCAGTAYEMGAQHARALGGEIRSVLEQYCALLGRRLDAVDENLRAFQAVTPTPEVHFTPAALEELRGISDVLGLPGEYLFALNLGLYPASAGGCVQFAITAQHNRGSGMIHGVNEDWPLALKLPAVLTRAVQVRHPAGGIPHLYFSVAGQSGGLNGLNACGLAVSSTMLLDCQHDNGTIMSGTIHPVLVQMILERAMDIDSAVDIVRQTAKLGAWSLCITHHSSDEICYLEYDGDSVQVRRGQAVLASTNHALLHESRTEIPEHSRYRHDRLQHLMGLNGNASLTLAEAQLALRDRFDLQRGRETTHPTMNTIRRVDNQLSAVMRPALGEIWCTLGPRSEADGDEYHRLDARELLGHGAAPGETGSHPGRSRAPAVADAVFEPPDRDGQVMSRFVLRMVEAPLDASAARSLQLSGPALIVGRNPVAQALRARLEEQGATVLELPADLGPDQALAVLESMWRAGPIPHLFLVTPWDEGARFTLDPEHWAGRRQQGVLVPYLVCQQWVRTLSRAPRGATATLVAATSLGGDLGFSSRVSVVEGGALAGLLKAIGREVEGILVKVVDMAPETAPARVAATICAELASGSPAREVGYVHGRRRVVRAVARPAVRPESAGLPRGGTWVVTGGARGITACVARELGRRFGWRLHLIGRSALPPESDAPTRPPGAPGERSGAELRQWKETVTREARQRGRDPVAAWREVEKVAEIRASLQAFADAGVAATYHACDVSDRSALARVLAEIRASSGSIQGILHGAGVEAAARFERKELSAVEATIAAKVDGAIALMSELHEPAPFFIGFGSISGRFGGLGQTDYSMASEMLCKLVQWFRAQHPDGAAVAIHWPAWDEVGMAMRPESKLALEMSGQRFMPPLEGIEHLCDEIARRAPEGEVLLLDRAGALDLDGILPAPGDRRRYLRREDALARLPLIDGLRQLDEDRELVAEMRFHPAQDPFLREHEHQGVPLLPAVIGIEAIAEAASLLAGDARIIALREVEIVSGMRFFTGQPQEARVRVVRHGQDLRCLLASDFHNRSGELIEPGRVHVSALVELDTRPVSALPEAGIAQEAAPDAWYEMKYRDRASARREGLVFHGPSFRCLRRVSLHATGAWGEIVAPPVAELGGGRGQGWLVPVAVLDACLVTCGVFAHQVLGLRQLPHAFTAIRLCRLPRARELCTVRVQYRGREQQRTCFDLVLSGDDGTPLLAIEGHRCILLAEAPATLEARP